MVIGQRGHQSHSSALGPTASAEEEYTTTHQLGLTKRLQGEVVRGHAKHVQDATPSQPEEQLH